MKIEFFLVSFKKVLKNYVCVYIENYFNDIKYKLCVNILFLDGIEKLYLEEGGILFIFIFFWKDDVIVIGMNLFYYFVL